jgi:hypothetical protein
MNHDIGLRVAQGMAIAGNVRSFIPNFNVAIKAVDQLSSKNCPRKTSTDNNKIHKRFQLAVQL